MTTQGFLTICIDAGLMMVALSVALGFVRVWRGPSLADRVIALDMMTAAIIAFCGVFTLRAGTDAFLDIAIALALVGFLSVVALARYAERRTKRSDPDD